ncbi:MAG: metalloregulator ArsR/SmtB family transcription factor [Candidatus Margulisbacteria bacterium]|nr:metalloregulator ArsR/SmtB family transcription factor [Candidatus Margulisiibacteriota bacterium]
MDKDKYIKLFRALANEERLEIILKLFREGELCASDIEKSFFMEQSTTSHHLNYLKNVGLLDSRKQGRNVFYCVNQQNITEVYDGFLKDYFGISRS